MQAILVTSEESERDQALVAAALKSADIKEGARIALIAGSTPEYLALTIGALRSGIVPVMLHPGLTPEEQAVLLKNAAPSLILRGAEVEGFVGSARESGSSDELAQWPRSRPMLYTSGTTGFPKGVWTGLLNDSDAEALAMEERDAWGFNADDVHIVVSPLHHSAPMRFAMGVLLAGGSVVIPPPFKPETLLEAISEYRPTNAFMVPAHLQRLIAHSDSFGVPLPLESFRRVAHAGSACPEGLKRRALDAFPEQSLWEFYGSTEGQFTVCAPDEWLAHPGTVGRARPGRQLSTDEDGTIWCSVPSFARFEYWRDPNKTEAAWRGDAFSVFDIGSLDQDGYLYIDGRRDDLIITGGVNAYPLEIERALLNCSGVEDITVFSIPDESWGEMVCAAIVGPATTADLDAWAHVHLAPHKRPKRYIHVDSIPVTTMGKVRRSLLAGELGLL
jgi:long-chain acyl-CoA synthetase